MSKVKKKQEQKRNILDFSMLFFIFSIIIIPNVYYKMLLDKQLDIRYLSLSGFLLVLALFSIFSKKKRDLIDYSVLKQPVILVYFAYFLLVSFSSIWATNFAEASYEFLKTGLFFLVFLYLILYIFKNDNTKNNFVFAFIILGGILSIIGFTEYIKAFADTGFGLKTAYKVIGNNAHKNIFSQVLFITFSFSIYGIYSFLSVKKTLSLIVAFANFLLIALLMTRSVWVAIIVAFIIVLLVYLIIVKSKLSFKDIKTFILPLIFIILVSFAFFMILSLSSGKKEVKNHVVETVELKEGNAQHRIVLWKKSFLLFREHPLFGVGAGNWKIEILKYDVTKATKSGPVVPRRTHNDYLSVITETGIVGFLLYISIFILVIYQAIYILKSTENKEDIVFILVLLFALTGYLVYSFFSFPKERIETQIFLNSIMAYIVYKYTLIKKPKNDKKISNSKFAKPVKFLILAFLLIAVKSGYDRVNAEINVNKIFNLVQSQKYDKIYDLIEDANSPFANLTPFTEPLIKIQGAMLFQQNANLDDVLPYYEKALKIDPYHVKTYMELAQIYSSNGLDNNALDEMSKAYQYAPSNIQVKVMYIYFMKKAGKIDEAYEVLRTIDPNKKNKKYRAVAYEFLKEKARALKKKTDNQNIINLLQDASKNPNILQNILIQSINNNEIFEKILLTEIIKELDIRTLQEVDSSTQELIKFYNIDLNAL